MNNTNVRLITDTVIGAALCSLLLVITMYVPFMRILGVFICGIPLMYLACKRGVVSSASAILISLLSLFILTGNVLSSFLLVLSYAIPGFAFGIAASKNAGTSVSVICASFAVLLGFLTELVIMNGGDGIQNFMDEITLQMSHMMEESLSSLGESLPDNLPVTINRLLNEFVEVFMRFLPAVFIITAFGCGYLVSAVGMYFLRHIKACDMSFTKFSEIRTPKFISSMMFVFYIVSLLGDSKGMFTAAIDNIVLISAAILSFSGLSVLDYYLKKKIEAGVARLVIYIAGFTLSVMVMPFAVSLLPVIGYIDSKGIMRRELEVK